MNTSLTPEQISEIEKHWERDESELARFFVSLEEKREASREIEDFQVGRGWEGAHRYPVPDGEAYKWVRQAFTARGRAAAESFAKANRNLFCDRFDYCGKREGLQGEGPALAIAVADCLFMASTGVPFPITALSVYLVKRGILDDLCDCNAA